MSYDETISNALKQTADVHDLCRSVLEEVREEQGKECVKVKVAVLKRMKKNAFRANKSVATIVKDTKLREARYLIENAILKAEARNDLTDVNANRARVFDVLRKSKDGENLDASQNQSLYAQSAGSILVDKAMSSIARLESSIDALSGVGTRKTHGSGLLLARVGLGPQ